MMLCYQICHQLQDANSLRLISDNLVVTKQGAESAIFGDEKVIVLTTFVKYLSTKATVPRGFLSLPMLSPCTNLGIARAASPCTSGSANDRQRMRVIDMLRQGIGTSRTKLMKALKNFPDVSTPNTIGDKSPNSAEQSVMFVDVHQGLKCHRHIADKSATHRRHIGDACVNMGDAYSI